MSKLNIIRYIALIGASVLATGSLWAQAYDEDSDEVKLHSTTAVSKVSGEQLYKTPASDFTNTLVGIPGLTAMQGDRLL